ncbi:DUF481 domain-containing protein [Halomonas sp. V046]|uniref:DUF481 domain-containing protein n=1 Tax=Halomonas sp. V046 TaxID=3459611 RepID=UPI0040450EA3
MVLARRLAPALALCTIGILGTFQYASASPFYSLAAPAEGADDFTGNVELGYTHLSGNTNSETLLGKGQMTWITGDWMHRVRGEVRHVSENSDTSAEQYLASFRERRELDGPHYLFAFARWEKDRFSGYDHQFTGITGYGRQMLDTDRAQLTLELGPGYRADILPGEEDERLAVAYGALEAGWQFSETASLEQELSVEETRKNTTSRSLTALDTRINAHLSLRLSHEIKHNTDPPPDAEAKTDRITAASLRYRF